MLKPISQPFCCGALNACLELQMHLLRWLCDSSTAAADVTNVNLVPPIVPTQIEADWLWRFLHGRKQTRLTQAKLIADMSNAEKQALLDCANTVVAVADQFQPTPSPWPTVLPAIPAASWTAFKNLMEAFYERGLKSGLPYKSDGTPVAAGGVCYADYVKAFREAHRLNPDPYAQEVCVLCGGPLGQTPEVDHWIAKSAFPLLSVYADNLLPICGECNSTANKGEKEVHTGGSFSDWFHPYLRPGYGGVQISYVLADRTVRCVAIDDQPKADHLDQLLNLSDRWTRKFKAAYLAKQKELFNLKKRGRGPRDFESLRNYLIDFQVAMDETAPDYEVGQALAAAILEPACLAAWHSELGLVT